MAARTMASDMAIQVTSDMAQIFGGYGISKEFPAEKFYRDAKLLQIMDGTNDMVSLKAADQLVGV
jgi:butyryl-CoA dehydrogenase